MCHFVGGIRSYRSQQATPLVFSRSSIVARSLSVRQVTGEFYARQCSGKHKLAQQTGGAAAWKESSEKTKEKIKGAANFAAPR
jgi:hypothetical protein